MSQTFRILKEMGFKAILKSIGSGLLIGALLTLLMFPFWYLILTTEPNWEKAQRATEAKIEQLAQKIEHLEQKLKP